MAASADRGIALSTTSVAVVYAVMVETGYNRTELGKIILAACFINDIGTVLALGLVFANYNLYLLVFVISTIVLVAALPWVVPWVFNRISGRASEPEIKFLFVVLFGLGGLATLGKSEAVLPAYLVGMALAPFFMRQRELQLRIRAICFAFLTPWYFLKAGSLIDAGVRRYRQPRGTHADRTNLVSAALRTIGGDTATASERVGDKTAREVGGQAPIREEIRAAHSPFACRHCGTGM